MTEQENAKENTDLQRQLAVPQLNKATDHATAMQLRELISKSVAQVDELGADCYVTVLGCDPVPVTSIAADEEGNIVIEGRIS